MSNESIYSDLWERVLKEPGKKIVIEMKPPSDAYFERLRKAFFKRKDEDVLNRNRWSGRVRRGKVTRDGKDLSAFVYFWVIPKNHLDRF